MGRERELAGLEQAQRDAALASEAILLLAPPGAGKSRLVDEFRARAAGRGDTVWTATVGRQAGRYGVVAELLRAALGDLLGTADTTESLLARVGSETARARLSVDHTLALLAGEPLAADPVELWTSWAAMLDAHPGAAAPVWLIEDVHLAPADLRAFLGHAIRHTYRPGRLVVLTARPGRLSLLEDESLATVRVLDLEPLDPAARRADLHQRFAEWLVAHGQLEHVAELVGSHLSLAHTELSALAGADHKRDLARHAAWWLANAADRGWSAPHTTQSTSSSTPAR